MSAGSQTTPAVPSTPRKSCSISTRTSPPRPSIVKRRVRSVHACANAAAEARAAAAAPPSSSSSRRLRSCPSRPRARRGAADHLAIALARGRAPLDREARVARAFARRPDACTPRPRASRARGSRAAASASWAIRRRTSSEREDQRVRSISRVFRVVPAAAPAMLERADHDWLNLSGSLGSESFPSLLLHLLSRPSEELGVIQCTTCDSRSCLLWHLRARCGRALRQWIVAARSPARPRSWPRRRGARRIRARGRPIPVRDRGLGAARGREQTGTARAERRGR